MVQLIKLEIKVNGLNPKGNRQIANFFIFPQTKVGNEF